MNYKMREISVKEFTPFVEKFHYSSTMPRITKLSIGGFREDSLVAGVSFGYGSRPRHTIQKLFPSLDTKDYLEIGKMCLDDSEPKNSESWFLARSISIAKKILPVKLIFTWADALWGKPGYIYQASNFLYGGFIWTDVYIDEEGKRLHPLQNSRSAKKSRIAVQKKTYLPTDVQGTTRERAGSTSSENSFDTFCFSAPEKRERNCWQRAPYPGLVTTRKTQTVSGRFKQDREREQNAPLRILLGR